MTGLSTRHRDVAGEDVRSLAARTVLTRRIG